MAKKKKRDERPEYKPTKRQLSHLQQQKRRQRLITIIGGAVIALAVILVGVGFVSQWLIPVYLPLHQTVLEVDGKKFNVDYYIKALDYYTGGQPYYAQYYLDSIIGIIKQNELVKRQAAEMGYSVSGDEVKAAIQAGGLEDNKAVRDFVTVRLLLTKIQEGEFADQVPQMAEHRNLLATFVESEAGAAEVLAAIEGGESFATLAADSLDSYASAQKGAIGWRPNGVLDGLLQSEGMDDAVFDAEEGVWMTFYDDEKYKDIGYWLIELLEKNEANGTVHVRAILLSSEEEALSIRGRLEAGEDFGSLAAEFSQLDKADENRGDLGFVSSSDNATTVFKGYVFNAETAFNQLSQPLADEGLSTTGGLWVFRVDGVEERTLSDENRQLLIGAALNDWVLSIIDDPTVEVVNYLDDEMRIFAMNRLLSG